MMMCQSRRRRNIDTLTCIPLVIIFFIKIHLIPVGEAVPLPVSHGLGLDLDDGNNSLIASPGPSPPIGCRYQGSVYSAGEEVPTEEPCLLCACKTSAVVCKLRICPEISVPPPPGCIIVHKARKCCAQLICHQNVETNRKFSREQKLPAVNSSLSTTSAEGKGGFCVLDGTVYAEGSAMRPRNPSLCQYCFCIRGEMKCSSPKCVIPLNGCKPRFRSYACCPTNYDCVESNTTAIVKTKPTPSTPTPDFLKGCVVNGKRVAEGEPVLPLQLENNTNPCQTCFCMGGVIHCAQLECDKAIEGCRPILEPGHCCPDRYDCDGNYKESTTTTKVVSFTTTERPEPLPQPARQKLKATVDGVAATSTEVKVNGSGSREDRRNKSYEDDEKEDSSSISFEHVDHDPNSMSFEDSTDQSASNSEADEQESDTEISPTEENNVEVEPMATEISIVSSSESPNNVTLEGRIVSTKNPIASAASVHEVGITLPLSTTPVPDANSTVNTTTEASPPIDDSLVDGQETTNISPSGISELHELDTSDTAMESTTLSIINQDDVENLTEVSPAATIPTTTTTTRPSSPPVQMLETTVKNVHFIPFGVEDAVVSPINDTTYESGSPPLNLSYDSHALKISLIPPTLPKGYERVPLHHHHTVKGGEGTISGVAQSQQTAALPSTLTVEQPLTVLTGASGGSRDDLRNSIMDIPVSTSLYSKGFYRNGIITEDSRAEASSDLEISSSRPFPGQVFDDDDDDSHPFKLGIQDAIPHPSSSHKKIFESTPQPSSAPPPPPPPSPPMPTLSNNNPARTYSKFGIQDSTYYRYGYRNTNGPPTPTIVSPPVSPVVNQQQQHHHRYYNAPEQEHVLPPQNPYYTVANEDELTYDDDEEGMSFEEQSAENVEENTDNNNNNNFNYHQSKPTDNSHNPPPTTPPVYVLAQSGSHSKNNYNNMAIISSTKSPSPISLLKINGYSNSTNSRNRFGFTPVVAFPFNLPKRPEFNLGLKLSGCNISGKMYNIGDVIRELSSACVKCLCTEVGGVQCSEIPCRAETNFRK